MGGGGGGLLEKGLNREGGGFISNLKILFSS